VGLTGPTPIDLQREANGQLALALDYEADSPVRATVDLRIDCGPGCGGAVPVARELASTAPGQWHHLKIPLACFAAAGTDLSRVTMPFALQASGPLALSVANIRLESGAGGMTTCPPAGVPHEAVVAPSICVRWCSLSWQRGTRGSLPAARIRM
ncbi:MAG: putative glycoside hydrolase, partial [Steroidobacteraceae bacterium]